MSENGAEAEVEMIGGGWPLLQKDFHDTLRRVAIPKFRTLFLLIMAVPCLPRCFGIGWSFQGGNSWQEEPQVPSPVPQNPIRASQHRMGRLLGPREAKPAFAT